MWIGRLCAWPITRPYALQTALGRCTIYIYMYIYGGRPPPCGGKIVFTNTHNIAGRVHDLIMVYPEVRFNIGRDVCLLTLYTHYAHIIIIRLPGGEFGRCTLSARDPPQTLSEQTNVIITAGIQRYTAAVGHRRPEWLTG